MKKVLAGLKVNEKDNILTASAKGMLEGTLASGIALTSIAGILYGLGKLIPEKKENSEETEEA